MRGLPGVESWRRISKRSPRVLTSYEMTIVAATEKVFDEYDERVEKVVAVESGVVAKVKVLSKK